MRISTRILQLVKTIQENQALFDYVKPDSAMPIELEKVLPSIKCEEERIKLSDDKIIEIIEYSIESAEYIASLLKNYHELSDALDKEIQNTQYKKIEYKDPSKFQFLLQKESDNSNNIQKFKSYINILETNAKAQIGLPRPIVKVLNKNRELVDEELLKLDFVKDISAKHNTILRQMSDVFQNNLKQAKDDLQKAKAASDLPPATPKKSFVQNIRSSKNIRSSIYIIVGMATLAVPFIFTGLSTVVMMSLLTFGLAAVMLGGKELLSPKIS
jgi:hypothetical protein